MFLVAKEDRDIVTVLLELSKNALVTVLKQRVFCKERAIVMLLEVQPPLR
jgi:hypothetical protein